MRQFRRPRRAATRGKGNQLNRRGDFIAPIQCLWSSIYHLNYLVYFFDASSNSVPCCYRQMQNSPSSVPVQDRSSLRNHLGLFQVLK